MTRKYITISILLFLLSLYFYIQQLAPDVVWGDSAKLSIHSITLKLGIRTEYHPLHSLAGRLFNSIPAGNIAFRQNFMSCVFASISVVILGMILFNLTRSNISSIIGSISLMVSHIFFSLAVITETYSFLVFSILIAIYCFILYFRTYQDYLIYSSFLFLGLSFWGNSLVFFLLLPFFLVLYLYDVKNFWKKTFLLLVFLFLGFFSVLVIIFLKEPYDEMRRQLFFSVSGGPFAQYYRSPSKLIKELIKYPAYLFYQFPLFAFSLGLYGIIKSIKENYKIFLFLLLIFLIDIVFASGYMRQRQFNLLIVSFAIFSIWVGIGTHYFLERFKKFKMLFIPLLFVTIITPLTLYSNMKNLSTMLKIDLVKTRTIPYRDNTEFFLNPSKRNERGAKKFAEEVFKIASPNSIIIADYTPGIVLEYYQIVENKRRDLIISKQADAPFNKLSINYVDKNIEKRNIYILEKDELKEDYNITELEKKYDIIPVGCIFKLKKKT